MTKNVDDHKIAVLQTGVSLFTMFFLVFFPT